MTVPMQGVYFNFTDSFRFVYFTGEVKEKAKAHKEYKEAVSKGHGAYLMDEEEPVCSTCVLVYIDISMLT